MQLPMLKLPFTVLAFNFNDAVWSASANESNPAQRILPTLWFQP